MNDLPQNWLRCVYHGHKRFVTNWRVADGRDGRDDYIGFELRKDGKFSNKIKRYNGDEILELEYGNLDEEGNPEPALYSEAIQGTYAEDEEEDIVLSAEEELTRNIEWMNIPLTEFVQYGTPGTSSNDIRIYLNTTQGE